MTVITLMTDFGLKDGNVGVMKGVILAIAPQAEILDLSHQISAQNIIEAAYVLNRSASYFPEGTIHVVVVDPGVGTTRRALAAKVGPYRFVGPDNGVISWFVEQAIDKNWPVSFHSLDQRRYWLPEISEVFHGRDIFAPVAAHLANGIRMRDLGTQIDDPKALVFPKPHKSEKKLAGEIIYIDHFGNLITNIRRRDLARLDRLTIRVLGIKLHELDRTFGNKPAGELLALFSSVGDLMVSLVNGDAAEQLGAKIGDALEVEYDG